MTASPNGWRCSPKTVAKPVALDFGTEAGLYQRRLGIPVVVCGPGSMEQAHRADEYLAVEQLSGGQAFVERLLSELA